MKYFIHTFQHLPYPPSGATTDESAYFVLSSSNNSLIVSILSAGTFFGALFAGDLADWIGRRTTIITDCVVFAIGVIIQLASSTIAVLAVGRIIAGFCVGFVSAIIILYSNIPISYHCCLTKFMKYQMLTLPIVSEIAPRKVCGAIVAGYQFAITLGLLIAACVTYAAQNRLDSGSYRIPISIQLVPAIILGTGLFFLPESPRYFVIKGRLEEAAGVLSRVRGQPQDSEYIQQELAEIVANHEYEMSVIPQSGYFSSWVGDLQNCLHHEY
jgi:MFS family permease